MNNTEIVCSEELEESERQTIKEILNDWKNDGFSKLLEITHFKRGRECIDVKKMRPDISNIIDKNEIKVNNEIQKGIKNAAISHTNLALYKTN